MNGFYFDSVNIAPDNKGKEQDRQLAAESDQEDSPLNDYDYSDDTTPKNQEAGAIIQDREDDQITKNADEWNFADI